MTVQLIVGMTSAALSFLMSGLLEVYVRSYQFDDCRGNVSIAWQLPQLLFISIAEVMVCVTGLEFAYSQAPPQYRYYIDLCCTVEPPNIGHTYGTHAAVCP